MRGGVSEILEVGRASRPSSPRAWGCFLSVVHAGRLTAVFPTCVGVFRSSTGHIAAGNSLPHVRGGVSDSTIRYDSSYESSPRAWGCFHMPGSELKSAEGLPHVRGGVSVELAGRRYTSRSSPRAWGCFRISRGQAPSLPVFPTCVGVFLNRGGRRHRGEGLRLI